MKETKKKDANKSVVSNFSRIVQSHEAFRFNKEAGKYTGKTARSLKEFLLILKVVDVKSVNFHFKRGDFQKWIQNIVGDIKLSNKIRKIPREVHGEKLRNELTRIIKEQEIEQNQKQ